MAPTSEAKVFTIFPINTNDIIVGKENLENRFCRRQAITLNVLCLYHFEPTSSKVPTCATEAGCFVLWHENTDHTFTTWCNTTTVGSQLLQTSVCQNIQGNCINHWLPINKFMVGGSAVWRPSWISLLMRQCLSVYGLQSHLLQICIISLISSKFHLFWAELDPQSGSRSAGRRGPHSLTISHPEGLPSGHTTHTHLRPSCFPAPLGHSSQQLSLEKVRPQMSDQIKRKSIRNRVGPKKHS